MSKKNSTSCVMTNLQILVCTAEAIPPRLQPNRVPPKDCEFKVQPVS